MRRAGYTAARFDLLYYNKADSKHKRNYYDLLTPAGFALLGSILCNVKEVTATVPDFDLVLQHVCNIAPHPASSQIGDSLLHEGQTRELPGMVRDQMLIMGRHQCWDILEIGLQQYWRYG